MSFLFHSLAYLFSLWHSCCALASFRFTSIVHLVASAFSCSFAFPFFFLVHDNISIGELAPLARVFTVFVQLSAHDVFLFTCARMCEEDCCRFVAAVKNDLVTKMLVNMSIYSSVNYMHEPKQTHQFQCTMPMIIGLMEMNRTPMTQRIITLNLLLTKLNQFALSLLLCASVCVRVCFFYSDAFERSVLMQIRFLIDFSYIIVAFVVILALVLMPWHY